jgi:hypothetical protein
VFDSAVPPSFPPRPTQARGQLLDAASSVQLTLVVVVGLLVLFLARVSRTQAQWSEQACSRASVRVRAGLEELREAIALYHLAEHSWPAQGEDVDVAAALAGYLGPELPRNPWNGRDTIRRLPPDAPWPRAFDGVTGWVYRPSTGEIRANVPPELVSGGVRLCDL